ncbi:tRNA-binding protein [Novosphingobium album (ex Liu et al. 2023)]|uniref:tRNA-binding protein n=1 Tax=Novosphingobium album (ex Liu et al. 2023) TaxID=3031130 RepID=A0ABT5WWT6_9SPHN|nr:tRNA-binding protein [Novosphingobium album (ex Liu et al. 2023)]MDE8654363.1 tRNA-binding protein [Novosphingobium album (ex Liu et al. 2023)]
MHLDHDPQAPAGAEIGFDDFLRVDIRVGTIVAAEVYEGARKPSLKLRIDFGPGIGVRKSVGQVAALYAPAELIGRQVAAVVNFPPRQIGKALSEALTLGFADEAGRVVLFAPDTPVPNGSRLF